jgi:hypothetical protein
MRAAGTCRTLNLALNADVALVAGAQEGGVAALPDAAFAAWWQRQGCTACILNGLGLRHLHTVISEVVTAAGRVPACTAAAAAANPAVAAAALAGE